MNYQVKILNALIILLLSSSCNIDESTQPQETKQSEEKELLNLILDYNQTEYLTNISNTSITNSKKLPFLSEQVTIKSFKVSQNSTINLTIGQVFDIRNGPFNIIVIAENGSSKNYSLNLTVPNCLNNWTGFVA